MSKLVLLRHGQSLWNKKNIFTGWVDVPLSADGTKEAIEAGEKIANISFDAIFTSQLIRSIETAMLCMTKNFSRKTPVIQHSDNSKMQEWSKIYAPMTLHEIIPVYTHWQLNERYYGELQGFDKTKTAQKYGEDQVHLWRRSYDVAPPNGESLKDTANRVIPFVQKTIFPLLNEKENMLIVAHGNSLRAIVMHLDKLSEDQVLDLEIYTGIPIIYNYENGDFSK